MVLIDYFLSFIHLRLKLAFNSIDTLLSQCVICLNQLLLVIRLKISFLYWIDLAYLKGYMPFQNLLGNNLELIKVTLLVLIVIDKRHVATID